MKRLAAFAAFLVVIAACAVHPSGPHREYHPGMATFRNLAKAGQQAAAGAVQSAVTGIQSVPQASAPEQGYAYDPGPGGYTISGAPAAPAYDAYSDPAYLAFVAALDQQQAAYGADLQSRMGQVDSQLNTLLPRIAEQGVQQRDHISGSAEARGMYRSGARLKNISLQQQGEAQRVSDAQTAAAQQKSAMQSAYEQQLADLARQRAEKVMELNAANAY